MHCDIDAGEYSTRGGGPWNSQHRWAPNCTCLTAPRAISRGPQMSQDPARAPPPSYCTRPNKNHNAHGCINHRCINSYNCIFSRWKRLALQVMPVNWLCQESYCHDASLCLLYIQGWEFVHRILEWIARFLPKNKHISDLLMIAHSFWATWANCSQSLICPEQFAHFDQKEWANILL